MCVGGGGGEKSSFTLTNRRSGKSFSHAEEKAQKLWNNFDMLHLSFRHTEGCAKSFNSFKGYHKMFYPVSNL